MDCLFGQSGKVKFKKTGVIKYGRMEKVDEFILSYLDKYPTALSLTNHDKTGGFIFPDAPDAREFIVELLTNKKE